MDLKVGARTRVIHLPGCPRSGDVTTWGYGRHIGGIRDLAEHTGSFPLVHACVTCLPGVCKCRKCR